MLIVNMNIFPSRANKQLLGSAYLECCWRSISGGRKFQRFGAAATLKALYAKDNLGAGLVSCPVPEEHTSGGGA